MKSGMDKNVTFDFLPPTPTRDPSMKRTSVKSGGKSKKYVNPAYIHIRSAYMYIKHDKETIHRQRKYLSVALTESIIRRENAKTCDTEDPIEFFNRLCVQIPCVI